MQILVQVLATVIESGTVTDTFPIMSFQRFQRAPSGCVMVEITVYAPVAVQMLHCLFHVGNRVQYEAVTLFQSERGSGKEVHESFKDAAQVSRRAFRLDRRHILRRHASFEEAAADLISTRYVRETDGEIPLATHSIIQSAAIPRCYVVRDAPFRQIVRQWRTKQRDGLHSFEGRF